MKNIKLIITDLDFTLLHTNKSISEYSKNIFKKNQFLLHYVYIRKIFFSMNFATPFYMIGRI